MTINCQKDMEFKDALKYMLTQEYILMVNEQPVFTQKFNKEWAVLMKVIEPTESQVPVVIKTAVAVQKPVVSNQTPLKDVWNDFVERAEIPFRVTANDGGQYTVRQFSEPAGKKLVQIIKSGIDYNILVESTKNYYKTVAYKMLLSKYLNTDTWLDEYKEWGKRGSKSFNSSDGGNRFED